MTTFDRVTIHAAPDGDLFAEGAACGVRAADLPDQLLRIGINGLVTCQVCLDLSKEKTNENP